MNQYVVVRAHDALHVRGVRCGVVGMQQLQHQSDPSAQVCDLLSCRGVRLIAEAGFERLDSITVSVAARCVLGAADALQRMSCIAAYPVAACPNMGLRLFSGVSHHGSE